MSEDEPEASPAAAPKKKKPILLVLVVVVLVGAAAAAGVFLGPALAGSAPTKESGKKAASAEHKPGAKEAEEGEGEGEAEGEGSEEILGSVSVDPIVVDTRDADGTIHHLKVTLSFELRHGVADGDFRPFVPRGREAAIAYLRSQTFEDLTASDRFEQIRAELGKRVMAAVGEKKAARVLITDFVAQ
ncbi:MAG TPA: flagellar basal body-associated FliL family protein [Polyangiaceae bacterium]|jgi:flagellar basal body-associated protein FliL|nr:flagellar basal body-associated FliL family protein [Polyangiaceae bacterium]